MAFTGKSVLVATDLSPRCDRAVDRAILLADDWRARLIVVHVLDEPGKQAIDPALMERRVRATLPDPGADVQILMPRGSAPVTIAKVADETQSGLIVTGVARYNSVGDYFLGTSVDHVIRRARVPVLVVKQRPRAVYRSLLVAADMRGRSLETLLRAAALFPEARLHLIHAYQVPYEAWLDSGEGREEARQEARHRLDEFLNHPDLTPDVRDRLDATLGYGEVGRVVAEALKSTGADLLVLGSYGYDSLGDAAIGSTAVSLLAWVPQDTLLMR